MRVVAWFVAALSVWLSGCAISLSSVKFEVSQPTPGARFPVVSAEQRVCEVERELALYTDTAQHLWLACPYRYEGRTVPLVAYIGPDVSKGAVEFTYAQATEKIKSMRKQPLRKCGNNTYCADLPALGYLDLSVQVAANKARIRYLDLSGGLKEVEAFHTQLDTDASMPNALDPQLARLADPARVVRAIQRQATLAQHQQLEGRLQAAGLGTQAAIRAALDQRRSGLEAAEQRQRGTFEGFQAAYRLTREPADLDAMQPLAKDEAQRSAVFDALVDRYKTGGRAPELLRQAQTFAATDAHRSELAELNRQAEQARQAELARQEQARQAELRRQEAAQQAQARREQEARQAALKAQQAKAEEEACLRSASCRQAWEARKAECTNKVMACRQGCDKVVGAGSYNSFIANLSAAALARTCYAGCKCDNGFGDLVNKFNLATSGATGTAASQTVKPTAAATKVYECKIYCKSAGGPTVFKRIEAANRPAAARIAAERSNEFCAADGKSHASPVAFAESQCQER